MAQTSPSIRSVMADNGDTAIPLWATEVGAPTAGPGAVSECLQARILREAITLSKQFPLPAVTFIYSYRDRGTSTSNRENFFGVTRYDNSRKRSYNAVKEAIDD